MTRLKVKAGAKLAALRALAEKNEDAAKAITMDAVDGEAIEAVRQTYTCDNKKKDEYRRKCFGIPTRSSAVYIQGGRITL